MLATLTGCEGDQGPAGPPGENGRDGADGPQGEPGPAGANGADGEDATAEDAGVIESFFCAGALEGAELAVTYNATLFGTGDLFVAGTVNGAVSQASGSTWYAPEQKGYATGLVAIVFDVDGTADAGFFTLTLDRSDLTSVVTYREMGSGTVSATWSLPERACVHNFYRE